jgi:predicted TPR repeat methyltransferase
MSKESFIEYSKYYDLLYLDKDYVSEARYVFHTLSTFQPKLKQLLELGMGTGIHANLLGKNGLEITGIELSDSMATKAREKGLECYTGSCTNFSLKIKFDAAISLFHVISYLTTNDDLLCTFRNVNKHLMYDFAKAFENEEIFFYFVLPFATVQDVVYANQSYFEH